MRESIRKISRNGRDELAATYRLVVSADEIASALLPEAQQEFSEELKLLKNMMGKEILFVSIIEAVTESEPVSGTGIALNISVRTKIGLAVDKRAPRFIHERAEDENFFEPFSESFMETLTSLGRVYFEQAEKKDFAREFLIRCHPEVAGKLLGSDLANAVNIHEVDAIDPENMSLQASLALIDFLQNMIAGMPTDDPERESVLAKLEELKGSLPLLGGKRGSASLN